MRSAARSRGLRSSNNRKATKVNIDGVDGLWPFLALVVTAIVTLYQAKIASRKQTLADMDETKLKALVIATLENVEAAKQVEADRKELDELRKQVKGNNNNAQS